MPSALLRLTILLTLAAAATSNQGRAEEDELLLPPSHIKLRAGILHAPPFAVVGERYDGAPYYTGFQLDLLERLSIFALKDDNVTLEFDLTTAPSQYGDALDLVAKDCQNSKLNNNTLDHCQQFDLIVGDYYGNPQRSLRVDFSPSWLPTTMSTVKYQAPRRLNNNNANVEIEYTTLTQAAAARATVCVPEGTYLMDVVMRKFPKASYLHCATADICVELLKAKDCVLYVDDELLLRHRASKDVSLEVTREQFNTQYLVWPMRYDLPDLVSTYMKKWIYTAVANATLDELYGQYFQTDELCPIGTAGERCELSCHPVHGTASAQGICLCESTKWTGDDCSQEVPEMTNMIPLTLKVLAFCMLGINLTAIGVCGVWLFWQRSSAQVRSSQPFFLALVLLGCGISSSTIIAMAQEDDGEGPVVACMAIPWLYSVGFSITFGSLFAKIRRVHMVFKLNAAAATQGSTTLTRRNSRTSASTKHQSGAGNFGLNSLSRRRTASVINFQETLAIIVIVLLVDVLILVWWTIVSPLEWTRVVISIDKFGSPLESSGHCTSEDWIIFAAIMATFHLTLLSVGCYLCYVARKIPTQFHEGKVVSIAMISNLQIFLVGVPILVVLGAAPQSSFFVRSVIIWMNDFVVVTLIFGNLMYSVHFQTDSAEPEAVKAAIGHAMEQYANGMNRGNGSDRKASLKGSNTSSMSRTPPAASTQAHESLRSSVPSDALEEENIQVGCNCHQAKEINLTRSDLELNYASLRKGDSYRRPQELGAYIPSQSTPLPRSMMASSVSTQMHGNLTTRDTYSSYSDNLYGTHSSVVLTPSLALNAFSSMASVASLPENDTGGEISSTDHNQDAPAGAPEQRRSWMSLNMPAMLDDSASFPVEYLEEDQGCHTIIERRTTEAISTSSLARSNLPPVDLPDNSLAHLSYAASRIMLVRDDQEKAWKDRAETVSKSTRGSTVATGCEGFNDEMDTDTSTINSERPKGRSKKTSSCPSSKNGKSDRRKKRHTLAVEGRPSSPSKGINKMDRSDPGRPSSW